ncbi:MAG: putative membrane protein YphA (DoxX/SURF4 family) [Arenicella sp.]|jgi:uncharacterized membrane protein YphA (DoxX/SURF4 family)
MNSLNKSVALLFIRLLLGIIFFMQGFGKVFTWGVDNVYENFFKASYSEMLPDFIIKSTAYYTSYAELIFGFFLIIGFQRDLALYVLASVLLIASFGHGMTDPIWDLSHVMYRAVLLVALLFLPSELDKFRLDTYIKKKIAPIKSKLFS